MTTKRIAVLDVVGLTLKLIGEHTPALAALRNHGAATAINPAFPAVTCTAQAAYLTGRRPGDHGIVGNGWYDRSLAEVHFWRQSNHLVQAPKLWDQLRTRIPNFTCAQLFWWFNMHAAVDFSITPRPMYPADGRKVFNIYTHPASIGPEIQRDLGPFPFPTFWGPAAGVQTPQGAPEATSDWIARSAQWIEERYRPSLNLVYLPHLDYNLQRLGPDHPDIALDLQRIDRIVGNLADFFQQHGVGVVILSEYGISAVDTPVHLNRLFRDQHWLTVREELGRELLDPGASRVFAVADHQVAHIILNDSSLTEPVQQLLRETTGVAQVLDRAEQERLGLNHPRSGDLVAVAHRNAWFTYYYWQEDARAPDFARTVDIHRKPGYDPAELFLDPTLRAARARILWRLLQKRLGFRMLMDVVPLDATLVRGSHGAPSEDPDLGPVLLTDLPDLIEADRLEAPEVYNLLLRALGG